MKRSASRLLTITRLCTPWRRLALLPLGLTYTRGSRPMVRCSTSWARTSVPQRQALLLRAYILAEYEPQVKHKYVKNYNNWDADKITSPRSTAATMQKLRPWRLTWCCAAKSTTPISPPISWTTESQQPPVPVKSVWTPCGPYFYCFNFNPTYDASYKPEDWLKAVNNENFRHSIMGVLRSCLCDPRFLSRMIPSPSCRTPSPRRPSAPMEPPISPVSRPGGQRGEGLFFNADKALEYQEGCHGRAFRSGRDLPPSRW